MPTLPNQDQTLSSRLKGLCTDPIVMAPIAFLASMAFVTQSPGVPFVLGLIVVVSRLFLLRHTFLDDLLMKVKPDPDPALVVVLSLGAPAVVWFGFWNNVPSGLGPKVNSLWMGWLIAAWAWKLLLTGYYISVKTWDLEAGPRVAVVMGLLVFLFALFVWDAPASLESPTSKLLASISVLSVIVAVETYLLWSKSGRKDAAPESHSQVIASEAGGLLALLVLLVFVRLREQELDNASEFVSGIIAFQLLSSIIAFIWSEAGFISKPDPVPAGPTRDPEKRADVVAAPGGANPDNQSMAATQGRR
jgi:hypothetical protein